MEKSGGWDRERATVGGWSEMRRARAARMEQAAVVRASSSRRESRREHGMRATGASSDGPGASVACASKKKGQDAGACWWQCERLCMATRCGADRERGPGAVAAHSSSTTVVVWWWAPPCGLAATAALVERATGVHVSSESERAAQWGVALSSAAEESERMRQGRASGAAQQGARPRATTAERRRTEA